MNNAIKQISEGLKKIGTYNNVPQNIRDYYNYLTNNIDEVTMLVNLGNYLHLKDSSLNLDSIIKILMNGGAAIKIAESSNGNCPNDIINTANNFVGLMKEYKANMNQGANNFNNGLGGSLNQNQMGVQQNQFGNGFDSNPNQFNNGFGSGQQNQFGNGFDSNPNQFNNGFGGGQQNQFGNGFDSNPNQFNNGFGSGGVSGTPGNKTINAGAGTFGTNTPYFGDGSESTNSTPSINDQWDMNTTNNSTSVDAWGFDSTDSTPTTNTTTNEIDVDRNGLVRLLMCDYTMDVVEKIMAKFDKTGQVLLPGEGLEDDEEEEEVKPEEKELKDEFGFGFDDGQMFDMGLVDVSNKVKKDEIVTSTNSFEEDFKNNVMERMTTKDADVPDVTEDDIYVGNEKDDIKDILSNYGEIEPLTLGERIGEILEMDRKEHRDALMEFGFGSEVNSIATVNSYSEDPYKYDLMDVSEFAINELALDILDFRIKGGPMIGHTVSNVTCELDLDDYEGLATFEEIEKWSREIKDTSEMDSFCESVFSIALRAMKDGDIEVMEFLGEIDKRMTRMFNIANKFGNYVDVVEIKGFINNWSSITKVEKDHITLNKLIKDMNSDYFNYEEITEDANLEVGMFTVHESVGPSINVVTVNTILELGNLYREDLEMIGTDPVVLSSTRFADIHAIVHTFVKNSKPYTYSKPSTHTILLEIGNISSYTIRITEELENGEFKMLIAEH